MVAPKAFFSSLDKHSSILCKVYCVPRLAFTLSGPKNNSFDSIVLFLQYTINELLRLSLEEDDIGWVQCYSNKH